MRFGLAFSVALHAGVATAGIVALPSDPPVYKDTLIVPVTLVTLAPQRPAIPAPPPESTPSPESAPSAAPPPNAADNTSIPDTAIAPAIDPIAETIPAAEPAQDAREQAQDIAKKRLASRFARILRSVEERKENADTATENDDTPAADDEEESPIQPIPLPDEALPEIRGQTLATAHLQSLVKLRIERDCWRDPSDMVDADQLHALISFDLGRDGSLLGPPRLKSPGVMSGNVQVFVQRAFRAIRKCAPYDFLPPERYAEWKTIHVNFSGAPQ